MSETQTSKVDSSEQKSKRTLLIGALVIVLGALAFLAYGGIGDNLIYYWSPSELAKAGDKALGADIRLGGVVVEGSVVMGADGRSMDFKLQDPEATVDVHAEALPPAMFREGIGVLVEGTMGATGPFQATQLMVKHDNEYRMPETDKRNDLKYIYDKSLKVEEEQQNPDTQAGESQKTDTPADGS